MAYIGSVDTMVSMDWSFLDVQKNNHWHKIKVWIVNGASGSNVIEKRGPKGTK